jgi:FkbM family methyltransferase
MGSHSAVRGTIKQARDQVLRLPGVQRLVKVGARHDVLPDRVMSRLQPLGRHLVRLPDGQGTFLYRATPNDMLARRVIWHCLERWEETTIPIFCQLAKTSRGFADIGAYSGIYTLLACAANPSVRGVAFEPQDDAFEMLQGNVAVNPGFSERMTLVPAAAGDAAGEAILHVPDDRTTASIVGDGEGRLVRVVRADDEISADLDVDLVKIDVEGHQLAVLRGLERTLRKQPALIIECGNQFAPVRELLRESGYTKFVYLGPSGAVDAARPVEAVDPYPNFLCQ